MKTISEHIRTIHGKPHHIRKRVAFTVAAAGASIIALVWLATSVSAGVFALKPTSFADSSGAGAAVTTVPANTASAGLAGAAAAPAVNDAKAPAHIDIVDVTPKSSPKPQPTTIPF